MRKWKGILLLLVPAVALYVVATRRPRTTPDQPAPPNGYQVLDAGKLAQRSAEVFPTAYMTVLSIAQGVALGVLVSAGSGAFRDAPVDGRLPLTLEILSTLASILVVYYMYVWFVLVFRWAPGVLDSLIPLTLGGVEILLAISVGNHRQCESPRVVWRV